MSNRTRFVFVLGAHRSGTSLAAGACDALGFKLGANFIEASEENPKGFFEDADVVKLNDRMLRSAWLSWDALGYVWREDFSSDHYRPYREAAVRLVKERFSGAPYAALKDPRLSILLPFWQEVIDQALDADVYYLLTVRHPAHCAGSQKARNIADDDFHLLGKRREHALLLWATYMRHVFDNVTPGRLLVIDYESMLANAGSEVRRLAEFLGIQPETESLEAFTASFVEPALNRSRGPETGYRERLPEIWRWTETVYASLLELSRGAEVAEDQVRRLSFELDPEPFERIFLRETQHMYGYAYKKTLSLRHRLIRCIGEIGDGLSRQNVLQRDNDALRMDCERLQHESERLQRECETVEGRIQEILDSRAWKLILRLRAIKRAIGFGPREGES